MNVSIQSQRIVKDISSNIINIISKETKSETEKLNKKILITLVAPSTPIEHVPITTIKHYIDPTRISLS
jgi:hypothetical protein